MKREDLPFLVDLKGRVVVVTGAGGVICSELALAIAACGAKVAYVDWNLEAAQAKAAAKRPAAALRGGRKGSL